MTTSTEYPDRPTYEPEFVRTLSDLLELADHGSSAASDAAYRMIRVVPS